MDYIEKRSPKRRGGEERTAVKLAITSGRTAYDEGPVYLLHLKAPGARTAEPPIPDRMLELSHAEATDLCKRLAAMVERWQGTNPEDVVR